MWDIGLFWFFCNLLFYIAFINITLSNIDSFTNRFIIEVIIKILQHELICINYLYSYLIVLSKVSINFIDSILKCKQYIIHGIF